MEPQITSLANLDRFNLEKVYDLILDIDEKLQLSSSNTIKLDLAASGRLPLLQKEVSSRVRSQEWRKEALSYLKDSQVLDSYKILYSEYGNKVNVVVNLNNYKVFKGKIAKIYAEKQGDKKSSLQPLKLPPDTTWESVTIKFCDGHNVDIKVKGETYRSDFKSMGFEDIRTRKPDKQWKLLEDLSKRQGEISWESQPPVKHFNKHITEQYLGHESDDEENYEQNNRGFEYKKAPDDIKKTKERLTKKLKQYFGIDKDPFFPYREQGSYRIRINLISA